MRPLPAARDHVTVIGIAEKNNVEHERSKVQGARIPAGSPGGSRHILWCTLQPRLAGVAQVLPPAPFPPSPWSSFQHLCSYCILADKVEIHSVH